MWQVFHNFYVSVRITIKLILIKQTHELTDLFLPNISIRKVWFLLKIFIYLKLLLKIIKLKASDPNIILFLNLANTAHNKWVWTVGANYYGVYLIYLHNWQLDQGVPSPIRHPGLWRPLLSRWCLPATPGSRSCQDHHRDSTKKNYKLVFSFVKIKLTKVPM